jgi:hypothetical protein
VRTAAFSHGRGTVNGTVAAPLLHYIGRVFLCLTGDRDNRPNVGEERSILGTATGPTPASRASVSPPALKPGFRIEQQSGSAATYPIELALPARWNGARVTYVISAESEGHIQARRAT